MMKLILGPLFLAGYALVLWRIPRNASVGALAQSCAWAVFLFLLLAKWWFWPWYLLWLVPLGALTPTARTALIASVFSATAMLMYVPYFWQIYGDWHHTQRTTAATIFIAPAVVALLTLIFPHLRRMARPARRSPSVRERATAGTRG